MKRLALAYLAAAHFAIPSALLLSACAPPRATLVRPAQSRVITHEPTKQAPYEWTTEAEIPVAAQTLHHEGQVIEPLPEVMLNGVPLK